MVIGYNARLAIIKIGSGINLCDILIQKEKLTKLKNDFTNNSKLLSSTVKEYQCIFNVLNNSSDLLDDKIKNSENKDIISKVDLNEQYELFDYCQDTGLFIDGEYPIVLFDSKSLDRVSDYFRNHIKNKDKASVVVDFIEGFNNNYDKKEYKLLYYCWE